MKRAVEDVALSPDECAALEKACLEAEHQAASKRRRTLFKVISGGQSGADLGGLVAARQLGLETGGTAGPLFSTTDGRQEALLGGFGLCAIPLQSSWEQAFCARSMKNVDDSDATVAFRAKSSAGTDKTIGYAVTGKWKTVSLSTAGRVLEFSSSSCHRPVLVVLRMDDESGEVVRAFLKKHNVGILNIAGHRSSADLPRWQERITEFLSLHLKESRFE
jgi:hypothetical protein